MSENPSVNEKKPEVRPPLFSGKLLALVTLIAIVFAGLLFSGLWPRRERVAAISKEAADDASEVPTVTVAKAAVAPPTKEIVLPGTVAALLETPIYARAEGYLRSVKADIGDKVKKDQVLVELDTPELDQALRVARARLQQLKAAVDQAKAVEQKSRADVKLADINRKRVTQLVKEGVFARQQGDDVQAQFEVRSAELQSALAAINVAEQNIKAQEAEVARLEELSSFKNVRAPYDGIITVRNCATGNLITPSSANGGRELYRMANFDVLRIYVAVPQSVISSIQPGQPAEVFAADMNGRKFAGKVQRSANALDDQTRTQRYEVRVMNPDHALLPGMYVQVKFIAPKGRSMVMIPGDTLLTPASGTMVAVVDQGKVRMQKVDVGRDLGTQVEVMAGLQGDELLIINPSDAVRPGVRVRAVPRK